MPSRRHFPDAQVRARRFGTAALLVAIASLLPSGAFATAPFTSVTIEPDQAPWGKNLADVDGDGFLDALEGGGTLGADVYWYRYPTWSKFQIGSVGGGDDLQVGDIDGDGSPDVVVSGGPTVWYRNPRGSSGDPQGPWTMYTIDGSTASHDLALADVNADGKMDVLARVSHGPTYLYLQVSADSWTRVEMTNAEIVHAGAALADIDRDGRIDIVGNGYWLEQPLDPVNETWIKRVITPFPSCSVDVDDINRDGRVDVSLAPSESGPGTFAWFEAPADPDTGTWIQHDLGTVEDVHRHHLADLDNDTDLDIAFAEMHQSGTHRVGIYWNSGGSFTLQVLATTGSHNIAVGDIGRDGDLDILGANWALWSEDGGALRFWQNDFIVTGVPTEAPRPAGRAELWSRPNPFNVETTIEYRVRGGAPSGPVALRIYDARGRLVRTLLQHAPASMGVVPWDGKEDTGARAPAGVYFYRLETAGSPAITRRLVLFR